MSQRDFVLPGGDWGRLVDATSGNEVVPLPRGFAVGRKAVIRRVDSSGFTVTVTPPSGESLDGVTDATSMVGGNGEKMFMLRDPQLWESFGANGVALAAEPGMTATYRQAYGAFRVAAIGDSLCAGDYSNYPAGLNIPYPFRQRWYGDSPMTYANMAAAGSWDLVTNAGIGGQTSTQILARLQNDVIGMTPKPDLCVLVAFTWNDIGQGVTVAQGLANMAEMVRQLRAAGIIPVVCCATPDQRTAVAGPPDSAQRLIEVATRRQNQMDWCEQNDVTCVDLFTPLVDATGKLKASYDRDGSVHPNPAGYKAMGDAIQSVLSTIIPPRAAYLGQYPEPAVSARDILGGIGFFATDTSGLGTGWTKNAPSGGTASIVTDGAVKGRMQRVAGVSLAANFTLQTGNLTGWNVGDWLELTGLMTASHTTAIGQFKFLFSGANGADYGMWRPTVATRGYCRVRCQVPVGTTIVRVQLQLSQDLISAYPVDGSFDVGQVSVRNLTQLGLGN